MDNSNKYFSVVKPQDTIPKQTKQQYDEFTEDLLKSVHDGSLWVQKFKEVTHPSNVDRTLIRGLRILVIRQTISVRSIFRLYLTYYRRWLEHNKNIENSILLLLLKLIPMIPNQILTQINGSTQQRTIT